MRTVLPVLTLTFVSFAHASVMLCDFETLDGWKVVQQPATFERAPDAHEGTGAIKVTMPGQVSATVRGDNPPAEWDSFAGVSFWAKGDGSDQWGSLAIGGSGSNYAYQFVYFFPLKSTEWQQYVVPWRDWVPEGPVEGLSAPGSLPPSGIQALRLGTRWTITHNNANIPPHSYQVDAVELVESLPASPPAATGCRPLSEVLALLRGKQPVSIVCMGDSITAGTSLKNRDAERYATLLQDELRSRFGYDQVFCESRAVGGARLSDARAWVRRDFQGDPPDLITLMYGYNDKSGAWSAAQFRRSLEDYLDRLIVVTRGRSALLPLATMPGLGPRFTMMDDFADVVRSVCAARKLPCCDMAAPFKAIGRKGMATLMADLAHPNAEGHKLMAKTLADFLQNQ